MNNMNMDGPDKQIKSYISLSFLEKVEYSFTHVMHKICKMFGLSAKLALIM